MTVIIVSMARNKVEEHIASILDEESGLLRILHDLGKGIAISSPEQPSRKRQRVIGYARLLPGEKPNETIIQFVHQTLGTSQELDEDKSHLDDFIQSTIEHFRICGITVKSEPKATSTIATSSRSVFERQFVGNLKDIEQRLDYYNREEQAHVHGPFVRVWVADKQADELETRFTLMGMARDEPVEGKFGNYLIGEVIVLTHGNWVKGEAYDVRANDYFEKLGRWLVDGELPLAEDPQTIGATLELENRRLPMNEIDKWQAEATEYLQQSWRVDLKQFASGTWPGSLEAFRGALMAFGLQAKDDEFGRHSIRFWILPNTTHPIPGEACWMIGMSGCNRKSLYTVKNEEGYLEAEGGEPYAEIRVREIARGFRVDLLLQGGSHEEAIAEYLGKLYLALQRDGLQVSDDDILRALQSKRSSPRLVSASGMSWSIKGGRPTLSKPDLIYRLACAQEAEEIRAKDPRKRWKEIAAEIQWIHGSGEAGVKLLADARSRLNRLKTSDPEGLLQQVEEFRRKETKET